MVLEGLQPVESSWWLGYPWPVARSALNNTYTYIHTHIHTLHSITDHLCTSKISSRHTHQSLKPAPGLLCVCVRTWPFAETLNVNTAHVFYIITVCAYMVLVSVEKFELKQKKSGLVQVLNTNLLHFHLHIFSNWPLSNLMCNDA